MLLSFLSGRGTGERSCFFCFFCFLFWREGGSPTVAVTGRMDKSTYLGVRPTKFKTLLQDLHLIIIIT